LEEVYSNSIDKVVLFGSQATNKATQYSDYDVLILLKQDYNGNDENRILDICYDVDLEYDILIDAHLLSTNELKTKRGKQPIFVNALKNGIYA
jgi:predicted nucleotidyltransferase